MIAVVIAIILIMIFIAFYYGYLGSIMSGESKEGGIVGGAANNVQSFRPGQLNIRRRVTLHHTKWCGYCKRLKPTWNRLKKDLAGTGIEFIESDEDVAKTPGVKSYPTIRMLDENGNVHQFAQDVRTYETLRAWMLSPAL